MKLPAMRTMRRCRPPVVAAYRVVAPLTSLRVNQTSSPSADQARPPKDASLVSTCFFPARSTITSDRHPSQRSVGELDSQLSGGRNSQDVALGQSQRTRFRTFGTSRENLDGLSLPGGTVNDRLAIGRKPRRRDSAATKGEPLK